MPRPRPALRIEHLEPRNLLAASFTTLPVVPTDDAATVGAVRDLAARGEALGRSVDALMVLGDSNSAVNSVNQSRFLSGFGAADYDPDAAGLAAARPDLLATLAAYRATGSFTRANATAYPGFRAADVLAELPGALAATNAGVAVVMIGTNDVLRATDLPAYRAELVAIIGSLEAAGVVPVLSTTPPDTAAGGAHAAATAAVNQTIADVAAAAGLPVWNLWRGLQAVPAYGLGPDGIHLGRYATGTVFTPAVALQSGQTVRNLEALDVLAWVRRTAAGVTAESILAPGVTTAPARVENGSPPAASGVTPAFASVEPTPTRPAAVFLGFTGGAVLPDGADATRLDAVRSAPAAVVQGDPLARLAADPEPQTGGIPIEWRTARAPDRGGPADAAFAAADLPHVYVG